MSTCPAQSCTRTLRERLFAGIIAGMSEEADEPTPRQTPVWVQVADADFGAAVEAHGFRRVGRAMWRRDGGGLTWRIALVRAPGTPDAFLIQQGCAAIGLDDLVKTVSDDLPSERMTGTSFRAHSYLELVSRAGHAIEKEIRAAWDPPPRPKGLLKRFLWQPPKPPRIDRAEVARRIPFCVLTEEGEDAYALGTRDADIAEEVAVLTRNQILVQAATAMVGQANLIPQSVLQLLG